MAVVRSARVVVTGVGVLAAAGILAGCGSSSSAKPAPSASTSSASAAGAAAGGYSYGYGAPAASTPAASTPAAAAGTTVSATETEFSISLASKSFHPGTYTFVVHNAGSITHALTIDGPGVSNRSTGYIKPGGSASVTVTLAAGSYDIYCPVGNHKMLGMNDQVTVS